MHGPDKECFETVCEKIAEKVAVGYGISSSQAQELESALVGFEEGVLNTGIFPEDWTHKHSIGKGNLASVMWVVFLPPGQTTQDGIYVSCCFGKAGNGLVAGCAISNTSKKKYAYVPTMPRKHPIVDVDGTRPGTHYNDGYVNPLEVLKGAMDREVFLSHLRASISQCEQCLALERSEPMSDATKARYEQWKSFLKKWPAAKIAELTLDNYTTYGGEYQSYCNWLEVHTEKLGSIWGGSAYKFGVFRANPTSKAVFDSTHDGDGTYKWYRRYGNSAVDVLAHVKQTFSKIAAAASTGNLAAIDNIDFGHAVSWKIAFLYQSMEQPCIVPIYNKQMLCRLTEMPLSTPTSVMQEKLISAKPVEQDLFDYYDDLLERLPPDVELENQLCGAERVNTGAQEKTWKNARPTIYDESRRQSVLWRSENKDDELLLRLLASLRAKPFAILAGHSGTGKSRYVKKLAYMTCNATELRKEGELPGNYLMLQVRPNWHDSTDLLGFRNAMDSGRYQKTALIEFLFRAYHFKDTPFFLCLDEMNLAPVEQYFAEFLSAMESKEPVPLNDIAADEDNLFALGCEWEDAREYLKAHKFSIPKNLFIVGTVNMDETTNQFSRKVLDRAFTIEMTDVDFMKFDGTNCPEPSYEDTIEETKIQALLKGEFCATKLDDEDRTEGSALIKVQKALEPTPFAIAYRFASEYTLLKRALAVFDPGKTMQLDALDQAVLMKVLPRVAGEAEYITKVYGKDESEGLRHALEGKTVSLKKIAEILKRAQDTGAQYITFWP